MESFDQGYQRTVLESAKKNKPKKKNQQRRQEQVQRKLCVWDKLPLPFLALLASYLDGRDLQRCSHVFLWSKQFWESDAFKERLRATTQAQKDANFPTTARPRKHRVPVKKCFNCERKAEVRLCYCCKKQWVCTNCEPFDLSTRYARVFCMNCTGDGGQ